MIENFLSFIFQIVIALFNIILAPIDVFISSCLPWLSNGINYINSLFDLITPYISWLLNLLPINQFCLQIIIFTIVFKVTSTSSVWFIKLGLKWVSKIRGGS